MSTHTTAVRLAITSVLALASSAFVSTALAANEDKEQCAGVIKAGKNDCATSTNACHGHVTKDADPQAWIYVPKGTCERLVGARIVKVVDPTPKK
jgi:uncharacterized membrane protein